MSWLGRRARGSRRVLEYCRWVQGRRASQQTHIHTHKKDTWYRRRRRLAECVEPVRCVRRAWCDHAVPKNRHAPRPLYALTPCTNRLTTRKICALTGHCCHHAVVAPRLIPSGQPSAYSRRSNPQCTPATGIFAVVRMQSIITQIRLHRRAWGNSRRGAGPALRNQSDSLRVTQWNPSR